MSIKTELMKIVRQSKNLDLRDAHYYVNDVLEDPDKDPDLYGQYVALTDKRTSEVIECVFQNSPLQFAYCQTIVTALINKGYVTL